MKKAINLILQFLFLLTASAQTRQIDSLKHLLSISKNDTARVMLLNDIAVSLSRNNVDSAFFYANRGLSLADKINYKAGAARSQADIGIVFRAKGNYPKALTCFLSALKQEEELKDTAGKAYVLALLTDFYYEQGDEQQMMAYGKKAYLASKPLQNNVFIISALNMGYNFCETGHPDSAMSYMLEGYQTALKTHSNINGLGMGFVYDGLGVTYGLLGNYDMALPFYYKGIKLDIQTGDQKQLSYVYRDMSRMYKQRGNMDSCLFYAQKALSAAYAGNNSKEKLDSYKLLAKTYEGINDHLAVQYFNKEGVLADSVHSAEKNKEVENLNYNEHERQAQLVADAQKAAAERKENLQLSAIALFIPLFFLAILWLSRTKTHRRIIEFMSVLSLLLVFEFITLLTHPWIERLTNNTPVAELLILVALAAVLVPLHHNLTHWLKEKLVHGHVKEKEIVKTEIQE